VRIYMATKCNRAAATSTAGYDAGMTTKRALIR
jgi:hypothetical protein